MKQGVNQKQKKMGWSLKEQPATHINILHFIATLDFGSLPSTNPGYLPQGIFFLSPPLSFPLFLLFIMLIYPLVGLFFFFFLTFCLLYSFSLLYIKKPKIQFCQQVSSSEMERREGWESLFPSNSMRNSCPHCTIIMSRTIFYLFIDLLSHIY